MGTVVRTGPTVGVRASVARWMLLVLLMISGMGLVQPPVVTAEQVSATSVTQMAQKSTAGGQAWKYYDVESLEYKQAVGAALDGHRQDRYSHLSEKRYQKLRAAVVADSAAYFIEGSAPTYIEGHEYDIQLKPNAKPVQQTLYKQSPMAEVKEQHHLNKELKLGHLRKPTNEQLSGWAMRVHVVKKKDDEFGRLICDFRALNSAMVVTPIALGDVFDKVRALAAKMWKSTLDAWSGFNQVKASEAAKRLMTIITSMGLLQWECCPFGVANAPSWFQGVMTRIFEDCQTVDLAELDAVLSIFIDDLNLGTGDALSDAAWAEDDKTDFYFDQHLTALRAVAARAKRCNLRFKLDKCHFLQHEVEQLGMVAGCGAVRPAPSKIQGIQSLPRPQRYEDLERALAMGNFLRMHLSPHFSARVKPLRDALNPLQERRAKKQQAKAAKAGTKQAEEPTSDNFTETNFEAQNRFRTTDADTCVVRPVSEGAQVRGAWPSWWTQELEEAWLGYKEMVTQAVTLAVPDFEGMISGRNPARIYLDASKYGVGAGLFQLPRDRVDDQSGSHYELLGVRPSATKIEIDKALQAKKRDHMPAEQWAAFQEAHRVLSDTAARQQYDAARGWHRNRGRLDLVPLALFSKSLGKHQLNWTSWEKEMFAGVEALQAFGSIVTGMHVLLYTDALNSTVLGDSLKYPEKILRMLLKIGRTCIATWMFFPGHRNKVGDCMSRDMEDREEMRAHIESGQEQPKTLAEAFAFLDRYNQGELQLQDDMDDVVGAASESMAASSQARTLMQVVSQVIPYIPVVNKSEEFRSAAAQRAMRVKPARR